MNGGERNRRAWCRNGEEADQKSLYFSLDFPVVWPKGWERKNCLTAEIDFSSTLSWETT